MKDKKILIAIIISIVVVVSLFFVMFDNSRKDLTSNNNQIIGETDITKKSYGYPLISLISEDNQEIEISAGIYRFGDIDQDAIIDENDLEALKIMIETEKIGFTEGQIAIADVNEDTKVDKKDITMFNEYLKKNPSTSYDIKSSDLTYCITDENSSAKCTWQKGSKFKVKEKKDYYAFVKQNGTNRISSSTKIEKVVFDKLNEM